MATTVVDSPDAMVMRKRLLDQGTLTVVGTNSATDTIPMPKKDIKPTQKARKGSPFKPRSSRLDLEKLERDKDEFRGFFVLFWISMLVNVILTIVHNMQSDGVLFGLSTFRAMSSDAVALFFSDMCMVLSLFSAYGLNKLLVMKVFHRRFVGFILQHAMQTLFVCLWLYWVAYNNWRWVPTSSFTLHTIAMLFKIHSYSEYNGDLSLKLQEFELLESKLSSIDNDEEARQEIKARLEELNSDLCPYNCQRYPNNVTLANFVDYLFCPTLVYEVEYPRTENLRTTDRIRLGYLLEKVVATFGILAVMYMFVEHYILPVLVNIPNTTFVTCLLQLLFPFMVCYLLGFFLVFDCICNGFAEITRFADRHFYDDWWNSSSFDQFARKWNKPVHEFLLRHVYLESINQYKFSAANATYLTFFFSSCLHELVMIIVSRRVRFYLFVLQMFQIPLIWFGRQSWSRRNRVAGNALFWVGMLCGLPLLAICYSWEHYMYAQ